MEHKKKAWIVTAVLLTVLLIWTLIAVHDSAVAAARAARANKADAPATCPFSKASSTQKAETKKKSCCHSKEKSPEIKTTEDLKKTAEDHLNASAEKIKKYADMKDEDIEELMKQFTPEQLEKCPHLKARKTNKKK